MSTNSTKPREQESRDSEQPSNRIIEALNSAVNNGTQNLQNIQNTQPRRELNDYRNSDYGNMASTVFANTLRILFEPNADENPIPRQGIQCYAHGDNLPPQLTQLYDGNMGYGLPIDNITEIHQRNTAAFAYHAVVNWFTKHADSIKKRQNMLNLIINTITIGKSITDAFPVEKDEDVDEYIARLTARLKGAQPEPATPEPEPEQVMTASKISKKTTKVDTKKKIPVKEPVVTPAKKKATIQIETDSESEADLRGDDDDSELPVSESSDLDVDSEESELPKKKIGKTKKGGKR